MQGKHLPLMLFLALLVPAVAEAQEIDCLKCHAKLKKDKVVHAALDLGCTVCHTDIDARTTPCKKTNEIERGLSASVPDLCYNCHDKSVYSKNNVHPAVSMGCTNCHNPHSSPNAKLLIMEPPELCFSCHDKAEFVKKTVHPALEIGCTACHTPHSSDNIALLLRKPIEVCLECHPEIPNKPHAISGFTMRSHPVGVQKPVSALKIVSKALTTAPSATARKQPKELQDPARPGRAFYCGSCHNPHSSSGPRLLRYDAQTAMDLCMHCHKM
jgi:predicted CXXCH cytochrome family protein